MFDMILVDRFDTENTMWGPFLSAINGEQARQSDRGYWQVSSNDVLLPKGENKLTNLLTL